MTEENENLNNDDQIKHMYNEDIDISLPDEMMIPTPEAVNEGSEAVYQNVIEDDVDVSFKFAFIGAGQGGSRIVQTFR